MRVRGAVRGGWSEKGTVVDAVEELRAQRDHARAWCVFWWQMCHDIPVQQIRHPGWNKASDGWDAAHATPGTDSAHPAIPPKTSPAPVPQS